MSLAPSSGRPWGILVVDDDAVTLRALLELLRHSGYSAAGAVHLEAAMSLVRVIPFDMLIADLRLRSDNGLKVIRQAREQQPAMALIALAAVSDPAVEQECIQLGATYLRKPLNLQRLLRIVAEHVSDVGRERRWARKHVTGGFAARLGDAQAKMINMSYGGFSLEVPALPAGLSLEVPASPAGELRRPVDVRLLSFGLTLNAELVWTHRLEPSGSWMCGAELREIDSKTIRAWRTVVDALPK
jgi:CheY-like chemotaxis protein